MEKTRTHFSFSPFFLLQFNSCPNLLSNYANEFTVGGLHSRLSRDLDSLGRGQNVSSVQFMSGRGRKDEEQRKKQRLGRLLAEQKFQKSKVQFITSFQFLDNSNILFNDRLKGKMNQLTFLPLKNKKNIFFKKNG